MKRDVVVVGAGIVGLATAWQLARRVPGVTLAVLEKETGPAQHQSGRNSGVIHSGIYYAPGSVKAQACRRGKELLEEFCRREGVPTERCGKVVVAVDDGETGRLEKLHQRGLANGVACELIGPERLRELEPRAAGVKALWVPETGIVDYRRVCERLAAGLGDGNAIVPSARVTGLRETAGGLAVETGAGEFEAKVVVNCGGLHCDRIAAMGGVPPPAKIVPFRGEYYELRPERRGLVRNLIYPVPDPAFPFLGVHFTRRVDGTVDCGPNAVLALAREGYTKTTFEAADVMETFTYGGFLKLSLRHWRMGAAELWRSFSRAAFTRALQRLVPEVREEDLLPAPSGVRAQAVTPEGALVDDFLIRENGRQVDVLNAPSPAATSSLAIGERIAELVAPRLK